MLATQQKASILLPDPVRVEDIEQSWRQRLIDSFRYLGDHLATAGHDHRHDFAALCDRIASGPVSPWVSCLYSQLVAAATRSDTQAIGPLVRDLKFAAMDHPAGYAVTLLDDPVVPHSWWGHFRQLLDTDRARAFEAVPPPPTDADRCRREVAEALALLSRAAQEWSSEMRLLLRMLVLGSPTGNGNSLKFDAVSSFFLHGVVLANARNRKTPIAMIDMLVHETSHILLFGMTTDEALTTDRGAQRFASPVRRDPRPILGIFHACFVATRVHLAMADMLAGGQLTAEERAEAVERRERNGRAARQALDTIRQHASPTAFGTRILDGLNGVWATAV